MQKSMAEWIESIGDTPIPVMQNTITELTKLCRGEDIPIQDIIDVVETDPGLTVQLIRTCSTSLQGSMRAEVTSAQQAAMMLGVENSKNFLRACLHWIRHSLLQAANICWAFFPAPIILPARPSPGLTCAEI